ncbi:hypothetical protein ACFQGT_18555 [Natrialbaceae archaeon GCM10025810]|uniref:hypothetical protein n=1 Tax=Halovalidus salilacus TaxID=3075124 RepID=UPI00361BBCCF
MKTDAKPTVTRIDPNLITAETTVRHVDELTDRERDHLMELLHEHVHEPADSLAIGSPPAEIVIKFDDYYYISTTE